MGWPCLASARPVALSDYMLHHDSLSTLSAAFLHDAAVGARQHAVTAQSSPPLLRPSQAIVLLLQRTLQALQQHMLRQCGLPVAQPLHNTHARCMQGWPPPAAEDSQWRCGNTCCTSCWCKARRNGQPIKSRQPRRRHAAAAGPAGLAGGGATRAAAAAAVESGAGRAARAAAGWGVTSAADMVSQWGRRSCICMPTRAVRWLLLKRNC